MIEVDSRLGKSTFLQRKTTSQCDPVGLACQHHAIIARELLLIHNFHVLINDCGELRLSFRVRDLNIAERLDIWRGVFQEKSRLERVQLWVSRAPTLCGGVHLDMDRPWPRRRDLLRLQEEASIVDVLLRHVWHADEDSIVISSIPGRIDGVLTGIAQ